MHRRQADRPAVPRDPVSPPAQPASRQQPQRRQLPRYKVILQQNDNVELMFVVRTVMELTRLCRAEATHKMWEAHHSGRSLILVTHRERAELYVEQFAGKGLQVTIEPG
jgi:ATP-dependent Clp protease adaptor protein ClpS